MSAWMISNAHADFLATAYVQLIDAHAAAPAIARALLYENCASLAARYGDNDTSQPDEYRYRPWAAPIEPANVLKQAHCAAYQCCEHREWESTESAAMIRALIDATGGPDAALSDAHPWGIDEHPAAAAATPAEPMATLTPAPAAPRGSLAQIIALRCKSPLRPAASRPRDVDGLALFDHARQPSLL